MITSEKLNQAIKDVVEPHYLSLMEDLAADEKIETFEDIPRDEMERLRAYKQVCSFDGYSHKSVMSEIEDDYWRACQEISLAAAEREAEFAADYLREKSA